MNGNDSKDQKDGDAGISDRVFTIPPGYDAENLASRLADWLENEHSLKTRRETTDGGMVVIAKETGGMISRMVKRKAEAFSVIMMISEGMLGVRLMRGVWERPPESASEQATDSLFSLTGAFNAAVRTTTGWADAVVSELTDFVSETGTRDAVFRFIGDAIASDLHSGRSGAEADVDASQNRYVETMTDVETAWLAGFRESGEMLLAFLHTDTAVPDRKNASWRYVLTDRRAVLAGFTSGAFVSLTPLPDTEMSVTDTVGKDKVTVGDAVWKTLLSNDMLFREIAPLHGMNPGKRIFEATRLNFLHRKAQPKHADYAVEALSFLEVSAPHPLHSLTRLMVQRTLTVEKEAKGVFDGGEAADELKDILLKLPGAADGGMMKTWADAWEVGLWDRSFLAGRLLEIHPDDAGAARCVFPLMEETRTLLKKKKDPAFQVMADILYARCLGRLGRNAEAVQLLEDHLKQLPDETLSDLLPSGDQNLTLGEGGQLIRVNILERLVKLRGEAGEPDIGSLKELARLQPLTPERLMPLSSCRDAVMAENAAVILEMMTGAGLAADAPEVLRKTEDRPRLQPLNAKEIENRLRHPAGREGTMFRKVQHFLAAKNVPDHSALKSYAKRVSAGESPELAAFIADSALILGMKAVEAYISFGDLNTGVRGYDGSPPFILIGAGHLEGDEALRMSPEELHFAVGAEMAHIRFGHERISSRDVWEGTFDKAMSVVELVPVLGGYLGKLGGLSRLAGQAGDMAKRIGNVQQYIGQARDMANSAQRMFGKGGGSESSGFQDEEKDLISAFRVMQLTADRTALALTGDLKGAVRSMFKASPRLNAELPVAERHGLQLFLSRTDESGHLIFQDLAIRMAALFSFYLSEDYEKIREQMGAR